MTAENTLVGPAHLSIRVAATDDAALLAELGMRTFVETFAEDNAAADMAEYVASAFSPRQLAIELADAASIFFVADVDGTAAGYAKLRAAAPTVRIDGRHPVELVRLYVLRTWLGRGVGEALMRACFHRALTAGHDVVWLGVWERNHRAQAFYRKWHFRPVGHHVFQLGSDAQTDVLMARALPRAL